MQAHEKHFITHHFYVAQPFADVLGKEYHQALKLK